MDKVGNNIRMKFNTFYILALFVMENIEKMVNYTKRRWENIIAVLVNLLDLFFHLLHTIITKRLGDFNMDSKFLEELRQKYIKNPPKDMTPKLVKNMTDSDLLDMHYFLTEDDEFE